MASALGRADARAGPASLRVLIGVDLWFDLVRDIARFFDCKGFELRNADAHGPLKSTCSADASQDRTVRMSVSAVAVSTLAPHGRVSARSKARATAGNAPPPVVSRAKRTKRTGARTNRARVVRAAANWDRDGKESRNPSLGAISDANATRGAGRVHDVSWVDLLSTEVNDPGGVPSDEKGNPPSSEDAADGAFAAGFAATVATNVDDTDDAPSAAAPPPPLPSGFFVRKERHEPTCDCPVCVSLRTLLHDAPTPGK